MRGLPKEVRLLLYGHVPLLLETRCAILKGAGFDICTVADQHSFKGVFEAAREPYDLLVICHTVPANERIRIEFLAAQKHTPILQVERLIAPRKLMSEVSRLTVRL